jgi:hypothetical protein
MPPASPGNISAVTQRSRANAQSSRAPPAGARSTPPQPKNSLGTGWCDFANAADSTPARRVLWTAQALPTVTALADVAESLATPDVQISPEALQPLHAGATTEHIIERSDAILRVQVTATDTGRLAVLLPLDQLFDTRAAAALRLWRGLTGRTLGPAPGALPMQMINRLILGVRALDGHQMGAGHQEIATALLNAAEVSKRDWIDHDIRDRTGRLVRMALALMNGGYRRLLLYPYRRQIRVAREE